MKTFLVSLLIVFSTSVFAQRHKGVASGTTSSNSMTQYKDAFGKKAQNNQNVFVVNGNLPLMYHFSKKKRYEYRYSKKTTSHNLRNFSHQKRYKELDKQAKKASKGSSTPEQTNGGARRQSTKAKQ